jgi:hypothetical protein
VREASVELSESGKAVEDLAAELIQLKAAQDKNKSQWQIELEDAQQETNRLRAQLQAACDVETKARLLPNSWRT